MLKSMLNKNQTQYSFKTMENLQYYDNSVIPLSATYALFYSFILWYLIQLIPMPVCGKWHPHIIIMSSQTTLKQDMTAINTLWWIKKKLNDRLVPANAYFYHTDKAEPSILWSC